MKVPHIPALTELNSVTPIERDHYKEVALLKGPPPKDHSPAGDVIDTEAGIHVRGPQSKVGLDPNKPK